jgi:AcrR family transcriptional regulator
MQAPKAKERIVAEAARLFGRFGVRAVSLDDVAVAAGVTKKTIYYHFATKDDLVAAWLEGFSARTFAAMEKLPDDPAAAIRASFAALGPAIQSEGFRGCPYVVTSAELADPAHPAFQAAATHKARRREWFRSQLERMGKADPAMAAVELCVIWDGALAVALLSEDALPLKAAQNMVERILAE